jgi:hypothetical protein
MSVRWQKSGSFGFAKGWLVCREKPNVPFAGRLFYTDAQRSRLGEVAEIEAQMFIFALKFN